MIANLLRSLRLLRIRHQLRSNAQEITWLVSNVEYGAWRIRQCEERQKRLQAQAWALERPGALARRSRA